MTGPQRTDGTMSEPEFKKCYVYKWVGRIFCGLIALFVALFSLPFLTMPIWMIAVGLFNPFLLLFGVFCSFLALAIDTVWLNHGQTICITDDYLESTFFYFFRVRIPWEDVKEIRPWTIPNTKGVLVTAKKITPLHYVLGWQFGQTWQPGIIFAPGIRNYEELVRQIHRRSGIIIP